MGVKKISDLFQGTPIEIEAVRLKMNPKELTDKNHAKVSDLFKRWGIKFSNYTRTENPVHIEFVRDFLMKIYNNGYIFTQETEQLYCSSCDRFLPDRFVEGTCPNCGTSTWKITWHWPSPTHTQVCSTLED